MDDNKLNQDAYGEMKQQNNTFNGSDTVDSSVFPEETEECDTTEYLHSTESAGSILKNFTPSPSFSSPKPDLNVEAGVILNTFSPRKSVNSNLQNNIDKNEDISFKAENASDAVKYFCRDCFNSDVTDADSGDDDTLSSIKGAVPSQVLQMRKLDEQYLYDMDHTERGCFVIFNQTKFEVPKRPNLRKRSGTNKDAANLEHTVKKLGFEYVRIISDSTKSEIKEWIEAISKADHSNYDCFGCAILTHGGDNDVLYAKDDVMELKDFTRPFGADKCPSLAMKPKLFFIQACRGDKLDDGASVKGSFSNEDMVDGYHDYPSNDEVDGDDLDITIPVEADFLIANSTVPKYYSWRNEDNGSIFIQDLCAILNKFGKTMELMTMMTRVNRLVAYEFESATSNEKMNKKKQIPSISTRLTRELFFSDKQEENKVVVETSNFSCTESVTVSQVSDETSPSNLKAGDDVSCREISHRTRTEVFTQQTVGYADYNKGNAFSPYKDTFYPRSGVKTSEIPKLQLSSYEETSHHLQDGDWPSTGTASSTPIIGKRKVGTSDSQIDDRLTDRERAMSATESDRLRLKAQNSVHRKSFPLDVAYDQSQGTYFIGPHKVSQNFQETSM